MPAGELLGSRLRASLLAAELEQQGSTSLILAHTAYPNHIPHTTAHQCNKIAPKMTIFEVFQKISAAARGRLLHGRHSHAARRRSARALIRKLALSSCVRLAMHVAMCSLYFRAAIASGGWVGRPPGKTPPPYWAFFFTAWEFDMRLVSKNMSFSFPLR